MFPCIDARVMFEENGTHLALAVERPRTASIANERRRRDVIPLVPASRA